MPDYQQSHHGKDTCLLAYKTFDGGILTCQMLVMSCKLSLGSCQSDLRVSQFCIRLPKNYCPPAVLHNACFLLRQAILFCTAPSSFFLNQNCQKQGCTEGSPVKLVSETFHCQPFECQVFSSTLQPRLQLLHASFKSFCLHLHHHPAPFCTAKLDASRETRAPLMLGSFARYITGFAGIAC